jgi:hypothetical protein
MEFYFKNWVQLSYDFGKVVFSGNPQGKVCKYAHVILNVKFERMCLTF